MWNRGTVRLISVWFTWERKWENEKEWQRETWREKDRWPQSMQRRWPPSLYIFSSKWSYVLFVFFCLLSFTAESAHSSFSLSPMRALRMLRWWSAVVNVCVYMVAVEMASRWSFFPLQLATRVSSRRPRPCRWACWWGTRCRQNPCRRCTCGRTPRWPPSGWTSRTRWSARVLVWNKRVWRLQCWTMFQFSNATLRF